MTRDQTMTNQDCARGVWWVTGPEAGPTLHVTQGIDMGGNIAPVAWRYPGGGLWGEVWGEGKNTGVIQDGLE